MMEITISGNVFNLVPCVCGSENITAQPYPTGAAITCNVCGFSVWVYYEGGKRDVEKKWNGMEKTWNRKVFIESQINDLMKSAKTCECGACPSREWGDEGKDDPNYYIVCKNCGRRLIVEDYDKIEDYIEIWNNTPTRDALKARIDELESELEAYKARRCENCRWCELYRADTFCMSDKVMMNFITADCCCWAWEAKEEEAKE